MTEWNENRALGQAEGVRRPLPTDLAHALAGPHLYLSTACLHDLCTRCRRVCKFCGTPCKCRCHLTEGDE